MVKTVWILRIKLKTGEMDMNSTLVHRPDLFPPSWASFIKVLMVTVSLFGIVANLKVIIIIIRNKELRTPLTILLMNLSVADLVAGISIYPFVFVDVSRTKLSTVGKNIMCAFSPAMVPFFIAAGESVFTLCAISISRLLVIKFPLRLEMKLTKRASIIFSVASWFLSIALLSPNALTVRYEEDTGFCFRNYPVWMNTKLYSAITIIAGTLLPITTMTMTYIAAWRHLWRDASPDSQLQVTLGSRRKVMVMLGVLILTYICCWTPFYVYWTLVSATSYYKNSVHDKIRLFRFYTIAMLFALCNSTLDPIIYTLSGGQFRRAMYRLRRSNKVRTVRFEVPAMPEGRINKTSLRNVDDENTKDDKEEKGCYNIGRFKCEKNTNGSNHQKP